jgi:hypothetical protein
MIDYSRAELKHLSIHYVGNKGLGEELTLQLLKQIYTIISKAK